MNIKHNISKIVILIALCAVSIFYTSCKAKKPVAPPAPEPVKEVVEPPKKIEPVKPIDTDGDGVPDDKDDCPEVKGDADNGGCPKVIEKAFDYKNIQFEFNSSVLKTSSYETLEKIAQQIKKSGDTKYLLKGNSSAEGTEKRNMMLSIDRANAVKAYLVNNGIASNRLITKGFGESNPIADNNTEAGRILNRRVEIEPEN
ncbi:OmpA family protein [Pedobacter sp. SD-b]|uniref:OmpA family protein n=1 Tax=Pedobacter segetis TaxID=2793069 RepID=A0ABS1BMV3_9SPHI|nr:OmpA family protein [Pedobacter segetis]MBK0384229.1 OmpA family protein [Pedobacter segetis]